MIVGFANDREAPDAIAYRLITGEGHIQTLNPNQVSRLIDRSEGAQYRHGLRMNSLADNGIFLNVAAPGQNDSLIVQCKAGEAEAILDAAYGVPALQRGVRQPAVSAEAKPGLRDMMFGAFGKAVEGRISFVPSLTPSFGVAAMMPRAANWNVAPALAA